MITYNTLPSGTNGEITPQKDECCDLFHACVSNFEVKNEEDQVAVFDFIKNTNKLKVKINGLQHITKRFSLGSRAPGPKQPFRVYVVGKNGEYKYNNQIGESAKLLRYEPPYKSLDKNSMEIDINVLRLDILQKTTDPIMLYMTNLLTDKDISPAINVIETILKAKDASGNFIFKTQEDLDRCDEFLIELNIESNLSVSISILGYKINNSGHDI